MKTSLYLFLLSISIVLQGQQDSIAYWRQRGMESYHQQRFKEALTELRLALTFDGDHHDIEKWINRTFDGYVVLLKKEVKGSELAGQAYKLAKDIPTHALRVAEEALRLHPSSSSAIQQMHEIMSAYPPNFFSTSLDHPRGVSAIAISPDQQWLLSGCLDDTVRLWDIKGQIQQFFAHEEPIRDVAFSPDSKWLLTAASDNLVKIWTLDGKLLHRLQGHRGDISSVDISPDGSRIATVGWDSTLILWDTGGNRLWQRKAHDAFVHTVVFSPDGKRLATGGWDAKIHLWDVEDGRLLMSLEGHQATVTGLSFSPNGEQLASGSWDRSLRLWNIREGTLLGVFAEQDDAIQAVAFHKNGEGVFTACDDQALRLWSLTGELVQEYKGHKHYIWALDLSEDGNLLASGSIDGKVLIWPQKSLETLKIEAHDGPVHHITFAPDGKRLVSAGEDGHAKLWDTSGNLLTSFEGDGLPLLTTAFSADSETIASAGEGRRIFFWDSEGQLIRKGQKNRSYITDIALCDSGERYFSSGRAGEVIAWDGLDSISHRYSPQEGRAYAVALSADGQYLAAGFSQRSALLWNARDTQQYARMLGHNSHVRDICFSPLGNLLATASRDGTAILWNLTGQQQQLFSGHEDAVLAITFSPDGHHVLTASQDGTAKLWDLQGRELLTFNGHEGPVLSCAFSPDGKIMATAGTDGTIRFWRGVESFLNSGSVASLSDYQKKKYGLKEGQASAPITSSPITAPFYYIQRRAKDIQVEGNQQYVYFNAHVFSNKAYNAKQIAEKIAMQSISLKLVDEHIDYIARVNDQIKGREIRPSLGVRNTKAFNHSNLALWLLLENKPVEAAKQAELSLQQNIREELDAFLHLRYALVHLLGENTDDAFLLAKQYKDRMLESEHCIQIIGLMTGIVLSETISAGQFFTKEIAMLQASGLAHPKLDDLVEVLRSVP